MAGADAVMVLGGADVRVRDVMMTVEAGGGWLARRAGAAHYVEYGSFDTSSLSTG